MTPGKATSAEHHRARPLALAALVVALAGLVWLLVAGGASVTYKVRFQTATLLVAGGEVQIGGRPVGSVDDIVLTDDNEAEVIFSLRKEFAPLHDGTTAIIRATSLAGVANRYLALHPGPNNARELVGGTVIPSEKTTSPVTIDQLFHIFDDATRKDLQRVVQGFGTWYAGKGPELNQAQKYFSPAASRGARFAAEVNRDSATLTRFLKSTAKLMGALRERRSDITGLVSNTNRATSAIAAERASLDRGLGGLPTTLRRANTTFHELRATLDDVGELVSASKPATRRFAAFLREFRGLAADARGPFSDLNVIFHKEGPANDLLESMRVLPALARVAHRSFERSIAAMRRGQPVVDTLRPYAPEFAGFFRDLAAAAAPYDANGHYIRAMPAFGAFRFNDGPGGGTLSALAPSERLEGVQFTSGRRCPGTATQTPLDVSAPFLDDGGLGPEDCDPSIVLPGS